MIGMIDYILLSSLDFIYEWSGIPIPIHVDESQIKSYFSPNFVEPSVTFMVEFYQISVGSIAEWSVWWILTITELIVSAFRYVELYWPASCYGCVACSITAGICQRKSAWTPIIYFPLLKVSVIWKPTYVSNFSTCDKWNAGRSIFSLRVRNGFGEGDRFVLREVGNIIWSGCSGLCGWTQNLGRLNKGIFEVGLPLD